MTKQLSSKAKKVQDFISKAHGLKVAHYLTGSESLQTIVPAGVGGYLAVSDQRVIFQTEFKAHAESHSLFLRDIKLVKHVKSFLGGNKLVLDTTKGTFELKMPNSELAAYAKEVIMDSDKFNQNIHI